MSLDDIFKKLDSVKVNVTLDQVSTALTVLGAVAKLFFELKEKADRNGSVTKEDIQASIDALNERQRIAMEKIREEIEERKETPNETE